MSKDFRGDRMLEIEAPKDPASAGPLSVNFNWAKVATNTTFADPATSLWGLQIKPAPWVCDGRLGVPMSRFAIYIDNLFQAGDGAVGATPFPIFFQLAEGSGYPTRVVWQGFLNAGIPVDTQTLLVQVSGLLASRWEIRAYVEPTWTGPIPQIRLAGFLDRGGNAGILTAINGQAAFVTGGIV